MIVTFIFFAIVAYLVDQYVPMQGIFKTVFHILCVVLAIYFLAAILGVPMPAQLNYR